MNSSRQSPHFMFSPVTLSESDFLQTGQSKMSSRSCGIMSEIVLHAAAILNDSMYVQILHCFRYSIVSHA
jgi:hypothetical protein